MAKTIVGTPVTLDIPPEAKKSDVASRLMTQGPQWLVKANALQVTNAAEHASAIQLLQMIAGEKNSGEAERTLISKPLHTAWQNTNAFFGRLMEPYLSVDAIVRKKVRDYEALERKKAEDQRLENERIAQRERDKLAAKARQERADAERKAEESRRQARLEEQRALDAQRAADELAKAGHADKAAAMQKMAAAAATSAAKLEQKAVTVTARAEEKAEVLSDRAATVVAAIVEAPTLKTAGRVARKVWNFEILDPLKIDRKFLMVDEAKIRTQVRAMKSEAVAIIGEGSIRVWEEDDLTIKAAK